MLRKTSRLLQVKRMNWRQNKRKCCFLCASPINLIFFSDNHESISSTLPKDMTKYYFNLHKKILNIHFAQFIDLKAYIIVVGLSLTINHNYKF